jgi:hypothetical protein
LEFDEWGIKNPSFYPDFKDVNLTFIKSAHKKRFAQKTIFEEKKFLSLRGDNEYFLRT